MTNRPLAALLVSAAAVLAGCSWAPTQPSDAPLSATTWSSWDSSGRADGAERPAAQAVDLATGLIGVPYRWGGATPAGFDCSGLVYYTFHKAGVSVPRTSQEQYHAARPVPIHKAEPGDLVFFGKRGRISHVGIYIGDRQFVHAPETGRNVTIAHLGDGYYRKRFAGAGRID
jgi:cell wall-associated NlpC family hydrolase